MIVSGLCRNNLTVSNLLLSISLDMQDDADSAEDVNEKNFPFLNKSLLGYAMF